MSEQSQNRISVFLWEPGKAPVRGVNLPRNRPAGTFMWVDAENALPDELIAQTSELDLPGLNPQMLWHLFTNVSPQDPRTLYACLSVAASSKDGALYRSRDVGQTSLRQGQAARHLDVGRPARRGC